jgi:hypothetical protein
MSDGPAGGDARAVDPRPPDAEPLPGAQPPCYAHATAQAVARTGGFGPVPRPRRPFGPVQDERQRRTVGRERPYGVAPADRESDHSGMVTVDRQSSIRRLMRRLVASEAELEAEQLQREVAASGCCPVDEAGRGDLVAISGRLRTVVYTPRTTLPTLEAELYDGSDVVTLVWLGRRHIAGIEPGRQLTIKGRVATRNDRKVVYNPYYELEPQW